MQWDYNTLWKTIVNDNDGHTYFFTYFHTRMIASFLVTQIRSSVTNKDGIFYVDYIRNDGFTIPLMETGGESGRLESKWKFYWLAIGKPL